MFALVDPMLISSIGKHTHYAQSSLLHKYSILLNVVFVIPCAMHRTIHNVQRRAQYNPQNRKQYCPHDLVTVLVTSCYLHPIPIGTV